MICHVNIQQIFLNSLLQQFWTIVTSDQIVKQSHKRQWVWLKVKVSIASMYSIFTYICHKNQLNVGEQTYHTWMLRGIWSPYAVGRYAFTRPRGAGGSFASSAYRSQPKCSPTRHGPTRNSALRVLTWGPYSKQQPSSKQPKPKPGWYMKVMLDWCRGRRLQQDGPTWPKVRELWKSVCATGVRPSGKNVPGKKRAPRHRLVASHFAVSHLLEICQSCYRRFVYFFLLARNGRTSSSTSWPTGHMLFTWMMGRSWRCVWQKNMSRRISRDTSGQHRHVNLVRLTLTDSHKHCINQITSDLCIFVGRGDAISSTLVLLSSICSFP